MSGVNKAIIIGNLGFDPEVRETDSGVKISNIRVATDRIWKGKDGKTQKATDWHRIVAFGRLAEIFAQYLNKGKQVYVEGRIQTRQWEDKEGVVRYTTEIIAQNMQMLGAKADGAAQPSPPEEDLPF